MTTKEKDLIQACRKYVATKKATIRSVSENYNFGKSTLHTFIHKKLKDLNPVLYAKVLDKIKFNISARHIRGGMATKKKYSSLKNK